jgi:hypothetical protein
VVPAIVGNAGVAGGSGRRRSVRSGLSCRSLPSTVGANCAH